MMINWLSRFRSFLPFLPCILLCLPWACINKKAVLENRPGTAEVIQLQTEAEALFSQVPRTRDTALRAFTLMVEAARQSATDDRKRFERLYRAAWFAVWLVYHTGSGTDSELSNQAIILCNTAIQIEPDRVEGYYYRAMAIGLFAQEKKLYGPDAMREVRADAEKALGIDPSYDFAGPHRVLGGLYLRAPGPPAGLGSKQKAYRHFKDAEAISPGYPETLLFLAETCIALRRVAEARTHLTAAREAIPRFGDPADQAYWRSRADQLDHRLSS